MPSLEAIRYSRGSLALLDQRLLPAATEYAAIADANAGHDAIKCVRACDLHTNAVVRDRRNASVRRATRALRAVTHCGTTQSA